MTKIEIKKGTEISESFIKLWNKTMLKVFDNKKYLNSKNRKEFSKHIFFIVKDNNKIVSVGRLVPVEISFNNKKYNIMGMADVASLVKERGYGKVLMTAVLKYLKKNKKTGVGFCERKNDTFYEKCGFDINKDLLDKFIYINNNGKISRDKGDDDVVYFENKDNFIKNVSSKKLNVPIPMPHW